MLVVFLCDLHDGECVHRRKALQVPDPWGEDLESYRTVFTMIDTATDGLINFLTS